MPAQSLTYQKIFLHKLCLGNNNLRKEAWIFGNEKYRKEILSPGIARGQNSQPILSPALFKYEFCPSVIYFHRETHTTIMHYLRSILNLYFDCITSVLYCVRNV